VTTLKKIWNTSWRVAVGALLLLWAFHSIFVNEARELGGRGELVHQGAKITWNKKEQPPRMEQWRLGWTYGPPALWQTLRSVQPGSLALSFALMGGTLLVGVIRWRTVLRVQGLGLPFTRAAEISLVAHFFNSFLLGTVGGDVMKAYCAARETQHKKTEAVVTVFVDRVIGLWAMLVFATVMLIPNVGLFERLGLRLAFLRIFSEPTAGLRELFHIVSREPIISATALLLGMTFLGTGFVFLAFRGQLVLEPGRRRGLCAVQALAPSG
jgi:hypothetical protein